MHHEKAWYQRKFEHSRRWTSTLPKIQLKFRHVLWRAKTTEGALWRFNICDYWSCGFLFESQAISNAKISTKPIVLIVVCLFVFGDGPRLSPWLPPKMGLIALLSRISPPILCIYTTIVTIVSRLVQTDFSGCFEELSNLTLCWSLFTVERSIHYCTQCLLFRPKHPGHVHQRAWRVSACGLDCGDCRQHIITDWDITCMSQKRIVPSTFKASYLLNTVKFAQE